MNKETVICVDASQAGDGKVTCRIRSPSGNDIDIDIVENPDGTFSILFTPQMMGAYTINIKFGGQSVPGGEYDVQVRWGQGHAHQVDQEFYLPNHNFFYIFVMLFHVYYWKIKSLRFE